MPLYIVKWHLMLGYKKANISIYMKLIKHIFKNIICLVLISSITASTFFTYSYAVEPWPQNVYVASEGACLMDADSGAVLFGKDENGAYYPASITKVLTAIITLENCPNLSEQVTFSYDAVHIEEENSTIIGASEGDRLSVLDCLYSLLFQSANEVANALAEHVGAKHPELKEDGMSDRDVFIRMMNQKAAELGCRGSHFNNPSGLTDSDHYVTAYDMCLIMAAAIKNEQFLDIERHTYWTHAPIRRYPNADDPWNTVYPRHLMLKKSSSQYYSGTIAGKTGYTMTAGNTLVTACKRNGMTLVVCVLNAHANHYNDTRRLMDFGFDNFTSIKLSDYDSISDKVKNDFSIGGTPMTDAYTIGINSDARVSIPNTGSFAEVEKRLDIEDNGLSGTSARLIYTYGDRQVGSAQLKLIGIGAKNALDAEAKKDPLLARILGNTSDTDGSADDKNDSSSEQKNTDGSQASDDESQQATEGTDRETFSASEEIGQEKALRAADIMLTLIKIFAVIAIGAIILVLMRTITEAGRAKKREKRRIAAIRKKAYMNGEMEGNSPAYFSSGRTLRKTKRKRKR